VGNPRDACKGLHDVLAPACAGRYRFEHTDGRRSPEELLALYNRSDVIAIASTAESQPLPLLEGMACGCFPVATDVGIVPELVRSGANGLVVERSVEAFRDAFAWCDAHLPYVRRSGEANAARIASERSWDDLAARFAEVFDFVLARTSACSPSPTRTCRTSPSAVRKPRMRIAFLTPEFTSEYETGGGLGNYLNRITRALADAGHAPEVFVSSRNRPETLDRDGVLVHRVPYFDTGRDVRAFLRMCCWTGIRALGPTLQVLGNARALASALARREQEQPFDLVQSANYLASGLFVKRSGERRHVVRLSFDGELWARESGHDSPERCWRTRLEHAALRRADLVYAPSRFIAESLKSRYGLDVELIRPPALLDAKPGRSDALALPGRYLIHFGQFVPGKGTDVLARALPLVWREEPDLRMVWAGADRAGRYEAWSSGWGAQRSHVRWLGELDKETLYAVLLGAEASVIPSRVDNLPNTAIESLMLGIPVIGSAGASIDELVEDGVTGELVPIGDAEALAAALLRAWRGESPARKGFRWDSPLARQMTPGRAVARLLHLAGVPEGVVEACLQDRVAGRIPAPNEAGSRRPRHHAMSPAGPSDDP
jgi:glycosyltransferase involved in cell wall biosynthesis